MVETWGKIKPYIYGVIAALILFFIVKLIPEPILKQIVGVNITFFKSKIGQNILKIGGVVIVGSVCVWLMMGRPTRRG